VSDPNPTAFVESFKGVFTVAPGGEVRILDRDALRGGPADRLAHAAVFGPPPEMEAARWLLRGLCRAAGVLPASIQTLYEAMGRREAGGFTTPALNLRGMTYDMARAAMSAMRRLDAGPVVFELARSEMGYCFQTPAEYASVVMAAALREGIAGPLFIQGDHFQVNAKKYHAGGEAREGELKTLRRLVVDAVEAGFYNIDIDASTLVVLERPSVLEQQRDNFEQQADFTALVRRSQPAGVVVSVGGEIGEVGGKNSTPEEFRAFMAGFREVYAARADGAAGISKISVQTGTTHGGVPLADGTIARVKIDFDCLRTISEIARREYGMAGAVQHGASTLPADAFGHFPKNGAAEVHLATEFQNILLDHPEFPKNLRAEMYAWLRENCADERKPGMTDEQFYYKTRKKTWGPFKRATWDLPARLRETLRASLEQKLEFLFRQLNVAGGRAAVEKHVKPADVRPAAPPWLASRG
jgi:fructose/tagatose bisphosphate aldolase